ncbi:hypothetical protein EC915_1011010 [Pseudomonas sp. LP_7_YM]|nr:hypothetical protein EC915_1011010 [Pseudomonas sp. LP_7_YM]
MVACGNPTAQHSQHAPENLPCYAFGSAQNTKAYGYPIPSCIATSVPLTCYQDWDSAFLGDLGSILRGNVCIDPLATPGSEPLAVIVNIHSLI